MNKFLLVANVVLLFVIAFIEYPRIASVQAAASSGVLSELRAKAFLLTDDNGKVHGGLRFFADKPELFLVDETGTERVSFTCNSHETSLRFLSKKVISFLSINAKHKEGTGFTIFNDQQKVIVSLQAYHSKGSILMMENGDEQKPMGLYFLIDDDAQIKVKSKIAEIDAISNQNGAMLKFGNAEDIATGFSFITKTKKPYMFFEAGKDVGKMVVTYDENNPIVYSYDDKGNRDVFLLRNK